jgi:hypothetical protein
VSVKISQEIRAPAEAAATITDSPSAQLRFIFPAMPGLDLTDEERDELLQP